MPLEALDYTMPELSLSDNVKAFIEEFDVIHEAGGFWIPVSHPFLTGRFWRDGGKWNIILSISLSKMIFG